MVKAAHDCGQKAHEQAVSGITVEAFDATLGPAGKDSKDKDAFLGSLFSISLGSFSSINVFAEICSPPSFPCRSRTSYE